MKSLLILVMVAVEGACFAADETRLLSVGEWSKPVSDYYGYALRGRLLLYERPFRGPVNLPDIGVYLELEDVSGSWGSPMEVLCDLGATNLANGLSCELRYADGRPVISEGAGYGGALPGSMWVTLPAFSGIRLKLSGGTAKAINNRVQITLTRQTWAFRLNSTNDCFLSGKFAVNPPSELLTAYTPSKHHVWKGSLVLPPLRIPVKELE